MSARSVAATLLALYCLLPGSVPAQTLSPNKAFGRYQQFVWLEEHGLPQNTVQSITRTRDGYLWLGTQAGAARFDGVRFTVFDSNNTDEIKSSLITALLEDAAGNLWQGTDGGGLNRLRDGRFSLYTTRDGLPEDHVRAMLEDRQGGIWIGTNGGLARFKDGCFTVQTFPGGQSNLPVEALAEDNEGGVWAGTRTGLARFKDGRASFYTTQAGLPNHDVRSICWDRGGQLWIGTDRGLSLFKDGRFTAYSEQEGLAGIQIYALNQDREGNLWIGTTGSGLFRFKQGAFARYTAKDGLPGDIVRTIYQDPEGDLWVGTDGGMSQLRDGRFQVYTMQEGLARDRINTIYEDRAGSLWLGSNALNRIRNGEVTLYSSKDGLQVRSIRSLCEDADGNLWIGANTGVVRFKDGQFTTWNTEDGLSSNDVTAVRADRAGNLWVATYGGGVNRFRDGRFTTYTTREGLANDFVRTLFEDRAGNLWAGTRNGGISRFKDGRFTSWATKEGASNFVMAFYEDAAGSLWAATLDDGLIRFKDGKVKAITARDGLYDNSAFQILADGEGDSGNLWMSCNRGIFRVSLKELNDFADGRIRSVNSFGYGVSDGMLSRECVAGSPGGWKTRDGRLWFPTLKGAVVIDPRTQNSQPPLLAIEQVTLDRVPMPLGQAVRINPGQENLEIQYTALSWSRPKQIRFRYQLVGRDHEWVEAGTRRTAYYPYLPPGDYTFKVTADNGEGVWNPVAQSLRIVVLPPFYRTWWFLTLSTLTLLGAGALIFQVRVRQLKRAKSAQEEFSRRLIESQEHERKRIAAELHDSLSQSLVIIKNRAVLSLNDPGDHEHAFEQLEEIADSATQAISEVREISYALRPYEIDRLGLTKALVSMIKKVADPNGLPITAEIDEIDGLFSQEGEINLYRIIQESINNIVRHAQATAASVIIKRRTQTIEVLIQDNGKGYVVGAPTNYEPGQGGFGLLGLAERARIFGTQPAIQSAPGQGATITLEIPIPNQYRER